MGHFKRLFASGLLLGTALVPASRFIPSAQAQELKDELDALDDIPADDLSGLPQNKKTLPTEKSDAAPKQAESDSAKDTPTKDPLEDLPVETAQEAKSEKKAEATLPLADDLDAGAKSNLEANKNSDLEKELQTLDDKKEPLSTPPVAALTGVEAEPEAKVTSIDFHQLPDRVRLTLKGNKVMDWSRELRSKRKQIILEVKNASISRAILKKALDTGEFDGPVALVQAFDAKSGSRNDVKVLFQLRQFVDPTVMKSGNNLIVDFPILTDATIFKNHSAQQVEIPETFMSITNKMAAVGQKINFRVKDADLQDVLNFLSQASGKNFVLASGAASKVTLNVRNTPWDEVLRIILVNAKLGYQKVGNVYRIAPLTELRTELDEAAQSIQKSEDLIPLETRLYAVSYAKASDVKTNVADFMTKRGKSSFDLRTNTLIVTDIPETLEKVARYIKSVDRQTAQILIEARIVEAQRSFTRDLNLNWQLKMNSTFAAGSLVNIGGNTPTGAAAAAAAAGGATGASSVNDKLNLNIANLGTWGSVVAIIGAEEHDGNIKTISSPRIMAIDNQQATVQEGDSFPVTTPGSANSPPTQTYVDASLKLDVTPQVTSDGFVMMKLLLTHDFPNPSATTAGSLFTRKAQTQALVESGKTVVLGGIYQTSTSKDKYGLPFLRSIPVLGALFTDNVHEQDISNELLMFISPKVLNPERAFVNIVERENNADEQQAFNKPLPNAQSENVPDDTF